MEIWQIISSWMWVIGLAAACITAALCIDAAWGSPTPEQEEEEQ